MTFKEIANCNNVNSVNILSFIIDKMIGHEFMESKNSWKEFVHLKNIDAKLYASDYYDVNMNKYGVKYGTS